MIVDVTPMSVEDALKTVNPILRNVSWRYSSPAAPVDDLWQETRLLILMRYHLFDHTKSRLMVWASVQAHCACKHYLRDKAAIVRVPSWQHELGFRTRTHSLDDIELGLAEDPWEEIDARLTALRMLDLLPEKERRGAVLRMVEYYDTEIGRDIGVNATTVRRMRARSRVRLEQAGYG